MRLAAFPTASRGWMFFGILAGCWSLGGPARAAEYRLEPGDVIEFAVVGSADITIKTPINLDGEITLPLIGSVKAAGLVVRDLRDTVQRRMAQKVLRQRAEDGREFQVVIDPEEITVRVAEYRPVYVNGDVSKPGEQSFRSGLTVRQAVSLAGGYDVARFRINNPFLQAADLESEYRVLFAESVRQQARIARLEAELDPNGKPRFGSSPGPIAPALAKEIQDLEGDQFRTRLADRTKEKEFLKLVIAQADAQLKVLLEQQSREEAGVRADQQDLDRLNSLYDKGNLTITRVTEARRAILLSSTRLLQTTVQIERIRREREEVLRRLDRLDDTVRLEVTRDLQEARVQHASLKARLEATSEKILYTSTVRSQLLKGTGGRPDIVIVRKTDAGRHRMAAEEDTELLPGDVVEVSLLAEYAPSPPPSERRTESAPPRRAP
jgi:polysaccharide biosynthesis/export protein